MENAFSLVCNMWKVHTRLTSASDFFLKISFAFCLVENREKLWKKFFILDQECPKGLVKNGFSAITSEVSIGL
jgi:hypothetical protein